MNELALASSMLPPELVNWLVSEGGRENAGLIMVRKENGTLIFHRVENFDATMIQRVRAAADRYRPALERLAES